MSKCNECGQEIEQKFHAGDIVETPHGFAIVASEWVTRVLKTYPPDTFNLKTIATIEVRTGEYTAWPAVELRLVHGYFHIDHKEKH